MDLEVLQAIADTTGGTAFSADDLDGLEAILRVD